MEEHFDEDGCRDGGDVRDVDSSAGAKKLNVQLQSSHYTTLTPIDTAVDLPLQ